MPAIIKHKIFISYLLLLTIQIGTFKAKAETTSCGNNQQSNHLAQLILSHTNQQRTDLSCNDKLSEIALFKVKLLLESEDVWHNAGRLTPNQLLRHHGFNLPKTYPTFGNQVEAIAGGAETASSVKQDFLESKPHKALILGEDDFFRAQDQMGVAYLKDIDSEHQHYWVVIIASEKVQNIIQDPVIEVEPPVINKKRNRGREIREKFYRNKVRGRLR